ncbi:MAG: PIG-L family deacetylase [Firmicutes bacterium]|nr:PIG-L family deacetylase [Bacillota bacterium]
MKKLKIMAIYAHPADPITDCGGTLALHAERGDEITVLTLTHGGRIHPNLFAEEWRKKNPDQSIINAKKSEVIMKKRKELEKAAEIIGIHNLISYDFEDNYIKIEEDIVNKTAEEIARTRPDIIIMDYPVNAAFPDPHTLASIMIFNAINRVNLFVKNLDGRPELHVKQIFLTKLPVNARDGISLNGLRNDLFIDISSIIGKKIEAMDQFISQGYSGDFARIFQCGF